MRKYIVPFLYLAGAEDLLYFQVQINPSKNKDLSKVLVVTFSQERLPRDDKSMFETLQEDILAKINNDFVALESLDIKLKKENDGWKDIGCNGDLLNALAENEGPLYELRATFERNEDKGTLYL